MGLPFHHDIEWDPAKARHNLRKHGVSFERAASVFLDPRAMSMYDDAHSEQEDRWMTLGIDANGALLVVCHMYHVLGPSTARARIVSARNASRRETDFYKEG